MNAISCCEEIPDDTVLVDFGRVPVGTVVEKTVPIKNVTDYPLTYCVTNIYPVETVDRPFKISIDCCAVAPLDNACLRIEFRPRVPRSIYTEYYAVDDTSGLYSYKITVTGTCFGPTVFLNRRKVIFRLCKDVSAGRTENINIVNQSPIDATYQWLLPFRGLGFFRISSGSCGVIRARETIRATVFFTGTEVGFYTAELVCLVLHQEPLFITVIATVVLPNNPLFNIKDHRFTKTFKSKSRSAHLMENSLNRLKYIPPASVFERYLDFGVGSTTDNTLNISQTLSVTNHEDHEGYMQWMPDPNVIFLVYPMESIIPPKDARTFTVRFRPNVDNQMYGYLLCGDYQQKQFNDDAKIKLKHTWFRIPCIGHTWSPHTEWNTDWDCHLEIVLPPTVPMRTTFKNFMLSNKLDSPMYYKFLPPNGTNYVVLPMCGIVPNRGWEIITAALEPNSSGQFLENWTLVINMVEKVQIQLCGSAKPSQIEIISNGFNPDTHAMHEFPPTISGCTNYCSSYVQNLTRMVVHIRVVTHVAWLGADNCGTIEINPKEIVKFRWWFFPTEPNKVYETKVTMSCVCLVDKKPVGEPEEYFVHISGFSELPDLRVLPKRTNLHDIVVDESVPYEVTLYNFSSCIFTSKLYYEISGMGDDHTGDRFEIDQTINTLNPSNHCKVNLTVTPHGAGSRKIEIKYMILFCNENNEVEEIQPIKKKIGTIWYDGIYPTMKVKRTISVKCPVILSNHCIWYICNVEAFNRALEQCRPNRPLEVDLYAPDLCVHSETVELIFVMGCVYQVPVPWNLRREKVCDCEMIEVKTAINTFEMRHKCKHREMVELTPLSGIISPDNPGLLYLKFKYVEKGLNQLCYILTMPKQRTIRINVKLLANSNNKGILAPLRRIVGVSDYLAVLDCGKVAINNLDPVIRIAWLYNPTDVFTTWRLLRGNISASDSEIRCLLYFAEVPPLGKLAIPFAFIPSEMIDYKVEFHCSFGYDIVKILVEGQGGLPNCVETRLDIPFYIEKRIRAANRTNVVYLSKEHFTLPEISTHSLSREIVAVYNDTDHAMRFIWLPERIANIVNIVMTPCWGVIQPKSAEWITMTVYTLQEPASFTTTVACEILDLTARRDYQRNEFLKREKIAKCNQEFIITEEGMFHPNINACPPYVLDMEKPQPYYLAMTVSVSSKGQRDGHTRMLLKQMWEQTPSYDLLSSEKNAFGGDIELVTGNNSLVMNDIIRIIDNILWDALHSKMFKNQIKYYAKEDIPTYEQLSKALESETRPRLSKRVSSGICDAIVNKAIFHIYNLNPKGDAISILEA